MPPKGQIPTIRECSTPGCKGVAHAKGLCLSCYSTALRKAKREREKQSATADDAADADLPIGRAWRRGERRRMSSYLQDIWQERREAIRAHFATSQSYSETARAFHVSRQRVWAIIWRV